MTVKGSKSSDLSKIYDMNVNDIWKHEKVYEADLEEEIEQARIEELETAKNARNFWVL